MVQLFWANKKGSLRADNLEALLTQASKEYPYGVYAFSGLVGKQVFEFTEPGMITTRDRYLGVVLPIE